MCVVLLVELLALLVLLMLLVSVRALGLSLLLVLLFDVGAIVVAHDQVWFATTCLWQLLFGLGCAVLSFVL